MSLYYSFKDTLGHLFWFWGLHIFIASNLATCTPRVIDCCKGLISNIRSLTNFFLLLQVLGVPNWILIFPFFSVGEGGRSHFTLSYLWLWWTDPKQNGISKFPRYILFDERSLEEGTHKRKVKQKGWSFERWKYGWEKDSVKIETQTLWRATNSVKDLEIQSYSIQITWKSVI